MLPPLPLYSAWTYSSLVSPSHISLPRKGCRVGLHIVLFEVCSAFTALQPAHSRGHQFVARYTEGFSQASCGGGGLTLKRRLLTAHTHYRHSTRFTQTEFCEDRLGAPERLVHRRLRRHAVLNDISVGLTPELLGADLTPGWIEPVIGW